MEFRGDALVGIEVEHPVMLELDVVDRPVSLARERVELLLKNRAGDARTKASVSSSLKEPIITTTSHASGDARQRPMLIASSRVRMRVE